jgi:hypothetical protein
VEHCSSGVRKISRSLSLWAVAGREADGEGPEQRDFAATDKRLLGAIGLGLKVPQDLFSDFDAALSLQTDL